MKNIWKWILGIAGVVLVLAALVAAGFFLRRSTDYTFEARRAPFERNVPGPMHGGYAGVYEGHGPMMGHGPDRFHGPMMDGGGHGYGPHVRGLFPFGGLFQLMQLAFVALLAFGAYQLGKRAGMASAPVPAQTPPASPTGKRSS